MTKNVQRKGTFSMGRKEELVCLPGQKKEDNPGLSALWEGKEDGPAGLRGGREGDFDRKLLLNGRFQ